MNSSDKGAAKTRRLLELYLYLTNVAVPVARDRVRANVEAYRDLGDDAFDRQFERDKKDFRELGVEIATYPEEGTEVPARYRILPRAQALPDVTFTPEEMAALQVARGVWHQVGLLAEASGAVRKLVPEEVATEDTAFAGLAPRSAGAEPTFEDLRRALRSRTTVTFRYRTSSGTQVTARRVQPWQLVLRHGATYLRGHDLDRAAPRVFRLSRIVGGVQRTGPVGAYEIPADLGPALIVPRELEAPVDVTLAVAPGHAQGLRMRSQPATGALAAGVPEGWDVRRIATRRPDSLAEEIVGHGASVLVLDPDEVRDAVVGALRAVAGGRS